METASMLDIYAVYHKKERSESMNCIAVENAYVGYDEKLVVKDLDIKLPTGKITTIIGPNGCGKSTLLKAIGRILKPSQGVVYLNGKDIAKLPTKEVAKEMAILPQSPQAPNRLTVAEIVAFGRAPHQNNWEGLKAEDKKMVDWALEVTRLEECAGTYVENLSGGQRQRVWIAMALAQRTPIILLDEPTTYLDISHQLEIMELVARLNREEGITIVMVLHDINHAARYSDELIVMRKGKIYKQGEPWSILEGEVLRTVFRVEASVTKDEDTQKPVFYAKRVRGEEDENNLCDGIGTGS